MATKTETKEVTQLAVQLPVIVVEPTEAVPADVAFTLPPLTEEEVPPGSEVLKAGVLRQIRVDRAALQRNSEAFDRSKNRAGCADKQCKTCHPAIEPTWVVTEGEKVTRYYGLEIRGSVMCLNGVSTESKTHYGCGGRSSSYDAHEQNAHLTTLAEVVAYTRPVGS